jgi:predicted nucleic acid-binding protein
VTPSFVADASVAIAWVHPAQATTATRNLLESIRGGVSFVAPALWPLEVANALLMLVRRNVLTNDERSRALSWIERLRYTVDHDMSSIAFRTLSQLAVEHGLSVYDATYLELAQRRGPRWPARTVRSSRRHGPAGSRFCSQSARRSVMVAPAMVVCTVSPKTDTGGAA